MARSITLDEPPSAIEAPMILEMSKPLRIFVKEGVHPSLSLPVYAAAGGSLAVLTGALVALVVPDSWSVPVWIGLSFVLCTIIGLSADRFAK